MIHDVVLYASLVWLALLLVACAGRVLTGPGTGERIVAFDIFALVLVALLVVYAGAEEIEYFLDAALLIALLGYIGTVAAARYYGERSLF